jgi:hypothetical protein
MIDWPARHRLFSLSTFAAGLLFFVWIGADDESALGASLLGAALPSLFIARLLLHRFGGRTLTMRRTILLLCASGLLAGCLAPFITAVLIALKVSLFAEPYPPELVLAVLARTPLWALAGLLAGGGLALGVYARSRSHPQRRNDLGRSRRSD